MTKLKKKLYEKVFYENKIINVWRIIIGIVVGNVPPYSGHINVSKLKN